MQLRRRRVTIEIDHYKLHLERDVCDSPEESTVTASITGLTHAPPKIPDPQADASREDPLLPDEIE